MPIGCRAGTALLKSDTPSQIEKTHLLFATTSALAIIA